MAVNTCNTCILDMGIACNTCDLIKTPGWDKLYAMNRCGFTVPGFDDCKNVNSLPLSGYNSSVFEICALEDSIQIDADTIKQNFQYVNNKTVSFKFLKTDCTAVEFMTQLVGSKLTFIGKDRDGNYWIVGLGQGLTLNAMPDLGGTTQDSEATVTPAFVGSDKYQILPFLLGNTGDDTAVRLALTEQWIADNLG